MSLVEELTKLEAMRARESLSEDEFQRAKARLIDDQGSGGSSGGAAGALNQLRRRRSDKWLGGVCAGLAEISGTGTWFWRLLFALFFLLGGMSLVIYLLLWIFVSLE